VTEIRKTQGVWTIIHKLSTELSTDFVDKLTGSDLIFSSVEISSWGISGWSKTGKL